MSKIFTAADVLQVTHSAEMLGVEAVWCTILFKGCENTVKFYASPGVNENAFQRDMYVRLKAGEFGEVVQGIAGYTYMPPTQAELEEKAETQRIKMLVESDFSDLPITQARFTDTQKAAWSTYRQALRDITVQPGYPWDIKWPSKP